MEQARLATVHQFGVACTGCRRFILLSARPTANEFSAACNRCGVRNWYHASAVVLFAESEKPGQKSPQPQTR
jgi:hypothetical protein